MEVVFLEFCTHLLTVLVVKDFRNALYFALSITFSWLCWALIVKIGCKTKVHSQQETLELPRFWVKVKTFPWYELLIPEGSWPQRSLFTRISSILKTNEPLLLLLLLLLFYYLLC